MGFLLFLLTLICLGFSYSSLSLILSSFSLLYFCFHSPAESCKGVMAPPDWEEEDETHRKDTQKRKRAWVSVASLISLGPTRTWLHAQISTFSHPLFVQVHSHIFYYVFFIVLLSALLHDAIPLKESERREPFLSQASSSPNKLYKRVFQQAGC